MSDIFVILRNQNNNALTSIDGTPFVTLLKQNQRLLAQETVDLIYADAGFDDLPIGQYTVVVQHEGVEPKTVSCDATITAENQVLLLTFVYLEPERVFLSVYAATEKRL